MTLFGCAKVLVRESEDKNLDLQVERLVRVGCPLGNIRPEAGGAKNDRGRILEVSRWKIQQVAEGAPGPAV